MTAAPFRLDGDVALVTGGTRGIGLAIAALFAEAGAQVVVCGRDAERGAAAAAAVGVHFIRADVTDEDDVARLVDTCAAEHGPPSVLVNNAGPTDLLHTRIVDGPVGRVPLDAWNEACRG